MPVQHSGTWFIWLHDNPAMVLVNMIRGVYDYWPHVLYNTYQSSYKDAGPPITGSITVALESGYADVVTSADGTFDVLNPPPGFAPSTGCIASVGGNFIGDVVDWFKFEDIGVSSMTVPGAGPGFAPIPQISIGIPNHRSWALWSTDLFRFSFSIGLSMPFANVGIYSYPNTYVPPVPPADNNPGFTFGGNYDIIYYWWKLPDRTPCGERNNALGTHLILAGDKPATPEGSFGEYEYFDPNDPINGAPQPIIKFVSPTAGRRGTAVEIDGEGFGDGANVQFDGVDADNIEVVSQFKITCNAPAHANGFANIVVINPDGVTS